MRRKTTFLITWRKSGILTVKWLWNSSFLLCSFKILEDLELQTSNVHFTWHLLSCKGWQGFYEPRQVRKDFHVTFSSFLTWEKFDSQMSTTVLLLLREVDPQMSTISCLWVDHMTHKTSLTVTTVRRSRDCREITSREDRPTRALLRSKSFDSED